MRPDLLIIHASERQPRNEACLSKVLAVQGLQLHHQGASAAQLSELLQERAALQARLDMMQQHAAVTLKHAASAQVGLLHAGTICSRRAISSWARNGNDCIASPGIWHEGASQGRRTYTKQWRSCWLLLQCEMLLSILNAEQQAGKET